MTINVLFVIVAAFVVGKMIQGQKRGMVKEIISFVSLIVISIIATLLANGLRSYINKEIMNLIITVVFIIIIVVIHSFISVIFFTAKVFSKLPVVSWLDKTMGILVGALEAVIFLWILDYFLMVMDMGTAGTWLIQNTKENSVLMWFFEHNYLVKFLEQAGVSNLTNLL